MDDRVRERVLPVWLRKEQRIIPEICVILMITSTPPCTLTYPLPPPPPFFFHLPDAIGPT
jgi:hypothetical protein